MMPALLKQSNLYFKEKKRGKNWYAFSKI